MKKVIIFFCAVAIAIAVVFNINAGLNNSNSLSDLALANIEALAQNESGNGNLDCYSEIRTSGDKKEHTWEVTRCNGCDLVECYEYKNPSKC